MSEFHVLISISVINLHFKLPPPPSPKHSLPHNLTMKLFLMTVFVIKLLPSPEFQSGSHTNSPTKFGNLLHIPLCHLLNFYPPPPLHVLPLGSPNVNRHMVGNHIRYGIRIDCDSVNNQISFCVNPSQPDSYSNFRLNFWWCVPICMRQQRATDQLTDPPHRRISSCWKYTLWPRIPQNM